MPIVCINRPNRTKPRRYSKRDVARIYCYVATREPYPIQEFAALAAEYCPEVEQSAVPEWVRVLRAVVDLLKTIVQAALFLIGNWIPIVRVLRRLIRALPPPLRRPVERVVAEAVALIEKFAQDLAIRAGDSIRILEALIKDMILRGRI